MNVIPFSCPPIRPLVALIRRLSSHDDLRSEGLLDKASQRRDTEGHDGDHGRNVPFREAGKLVANAAIACAGTHCARSKVDEEVHCGRAKQEALAAALGTERTEQQLLRANRSVPHLSAPYYV